MPKLPKFFFRISGIVTLCLVVALGATQTGFAQNKAFRAEAAITNITPPLGLGFAFLCNR